MVHYDWETQTQKLIGHSKIVHGYEQEQLSGSSLLPVTGEIQFTNIPKEKISKDNGWIDR